MARKKDSKSLFEVMGTSVPQSGKSLGVPSWFDQVEQPEPTDDHPVVEQAKISPTIAASRPETGTRTGPILSVSGGRLIISLNQISAIVVFLVIITLGIGAYMLGRGTSPSSPTPPDKTPIPHNPGTTRPGDTSPGHKLHHPNLHGSGTTSNDTERLKGYSYLVVQGGIQTRGEAEDIEKFLREKGVYTTIHVGSTGKYMVKDKYGFQNIRSAQTRAVIAEYVRQIERLGEKYQNRRNGRYGFKQSNTVGPWMITEQ